MGTSALVSVEEYLSTSYSPDREYRDGAVVERAVGNRKHALLQIRLGAYINQRRKAWNVEAYTELRIRAREGWYPIPDLCVFSNPVPEEDVPGSMPLLWIEILSPDDKMMDVWKKAGDLIDCGAPHVWIIDPDTLESELWTQAGKRQVADKRLQLPDSTIDIPLEQVLKE